MCTVKTIFCAAIFFFSLSGAVQAQQAATSYSKKSLNLVKSSSTETYSPSVPRLGLQFGTGVLLGTPGIVAGGLTGALLSPKAEGSGSGFATIGYTVIGSYIGYSLSSAVGVYWIANSDTFNASFKSIIIGHAIGGLAGLGIYFSVASPVALVFSLASPIVGGMIANKKSIKKRETTSKASALLNISDGDTQIAPPSVQLTEIGNFDLMEKHPPTVKLLNISL